MALGVSLRTLLLCATFYVGAAAAGSGCGDTVTRKLELQATPGLCLGAVRATLVVGGSEGLALQQTLELDPRQADCRFDSFVIDGILPAPDRVATLVGRDSAGQEVFRGVSRKFDDPGSTRITLAPSRTTFPETAVALVWFYTEDWVARQNLVVRVSTAPTRYSGVRWRWEDPTNEPWSRGLPSECSTTGRVCLSLVNVRAAPGANVTLYAHGGENGGEIARCEVGPRSESVVCEGRARRTIDRRTCGVVAVPPADRDGEDGSLCPAIIRADSP
jgi:hypothetical protein